ncbi:MAG: hypothetical protein ACYC2H_01145 [Thermoplasmatota archaeon]
MGQAADDFLTNVQVPTFIASAQKSTGDFVSCEIRAGASSNVQATCGKTYFAALIDHANEFLSFDLEALEFIFETHEATDDFIACAFTAAGTSYQTLGQGGVGNADSCPTNYMSDMGGHAEGFIANLQAPKFVSDTQNSTAVYVACTMTAATPSQQAADLEATDAASCPTNYMKEMGLHLQDFIANVQVPKFASDSQNSTAVFVACTLTGVGSAQPSLAFAQSCPTNYMKTVGLIAQDFIANVQVPKFASDTQNATAVFVACSLTSSGQERSSVEVFCAATLIGASGAAAAAFIRNVQVPTFVAAMQNALADYVECTADPGCFGAFVVIVTAALIVLVATQDVEAFLLVAGAGAAVLGVCIA